VHLPFETEGGFMRGLIKKNKGTNRGKKIKK